MRKFKITSYPQPFLIILSFALLIGGCSKKVEQPKSVYGQVTTLAGSGVTGTADGIGTQASFTFIWAIATDAAGNIYVTDSGLNQVRKITPDGNVTTLPDNGPGSSTVYTEPYGLTIDKDNNMYISYYGSGFIRKIPQNGTGVIFAGNGLNGAGNYNGVGQQANITEPAGLAVDKAGNVYLAGLISCSIREISPNATVTTFVGNGVPGHVDGAGTVAEFNFPSSVAFDTSGNLYVADSGNNMIRKVTPDGTVSTLAGNVTRGSADGTGSTASFNYPMGVAVDGSGNVYVADSNNNMIRKITPSGVVTTLAGSLKPGSANGIGTAASFSIPTNLVVSNDGDLLYVTDRGNKLVRQISLK